ncbi:MAG: hypothetical protein M3276_04905 [Actinomycetota bacterium]|nr:hypothetical protein [Actinomycetota bacterium]
MRRRLLVAILAAPTAPRGRHRDVARTLRAGIPNPWLAIGRGDPTVRAAREGTGRRGRGLRSLAAATLLLAGMACQPVDPPAGDSSTAPDISGGRLGAPVGGMPVRLEELVQRGGQMAAQWQPDPVLVELWVALDERGSWTQAHLTYLAPDADRFLVVHISPSASRVERPTLATLGLRPVPAEGLAQVPPRPAGTREPADMARFGRRALAACGVGAPPRAVRYSTGAPAGWDGVRWADPPVWTATVTDERDASAIVDPVTGAPAADDPRLCVHPARP